MPTVDDKPCSVDTLAEWLRTSGVDAAWQAARRPAVCPAWCTRRPAMDHQAHIGPGEDCMHTGAPVTYRVNHGGLPTSGHYQRELKLEAAEDYEDGLGVTVVNVAELDALDPDSLEALAGALSTMAAAWREIQA